MAFVLLGFGLVSCGISLVRSNREDVLASTPLAGEQEVTLASPGEVLVLIEAPRIAADYRDFQIELLEKQTGQVTTMRYSVPTAQGAVYGVTTMQVPFGRTTARSDMYRPNRGVALRSGLFALPADSVSAIYGAHGSSNHRYRAVRRRHAAQSDMGRVVGGVAQARPCLSPTQLQNEGASTGSSFP
jgi:hypothetical protein